MSTRATILLALAALALLAVLFLGPGGSFSPMAPKTGEYVLAFDVQDVKEIEITRETDSLTFQKVPLGWELRSGSLQDRANTAAVERILSAAKTLLVLDVFRPGAEQNVNDFGFANPRPRLRLNLGNAALGLDFGSEGAVAERVYVRRVNQNGKTEPSVFLVPEELRGLLLAPVENFRDPRLVPVPAEQIEKMVIERPDGAIELQRQGSEWRISRPLQDWADSSTINKQLELVLGARVLEFVAPHQTPVEPTWTHTIKVWPEGEDEAIVLRLADAPDSKELLVHSSARAAVMKVPSENFALARTTLDGLRSKKLLHFNPDLVDHMQIELEGKNFSLARKPDGEWSTSANHIAPSDPQIGERVLELLENTEVRGFLIGTNSDTAAPAAAKIALDSWLSENTPEATAGRYPLWELSVWRQEDEEFLFARSANDSGVRLLPPDFLKSLTALLSPTSETKPDESSQQ